MPLYRVQTALQDVSGLPRDQYVNTIHLTRPTAADWSDTTIAGDGEQIILATGTFYGLLKSYMSAALASTPSVTATVKIYDEAAPLHSPAVYSGNWKNSGWGVTPSFANSMSLPNEVACCLTYHAEPNPGPGWFPQSWRGRFYLGPLSAETMSPTAPGTGRPGAAFRTALLDAAIGLDEGLFNNGFTWVIYSRKHETVLPISYFGVDDAWDTQRSRGLRRTIISRGDVTHAVAAPGPA